MKKPGMKYVVSLLLCAVMLFGWIVLAVWLTGAKEPGDFTRGDWISFGICIGLELVTLILLFLFADKMGKGGSVQAVPKQKPRRSGVILLVSGILVAFAAKLIGITLKPMAEKLPWLGLLFLIVILLPWLFMLCNWLGRKLFNRRMKRMDVAQRQRYILSHREAAEKTAAEKLRLLGRLLTVSDLYALLLGLIGLATCLLDGISGSDGAVYGMFYGAMLLIAALSRIRTPVPEREFLEKKTRISREDYPQLYEIAEDAAKKIGYEGSVQIILTDDCGASVVAERSFCCVYLGVVLLRQLSRQELLTVMLHEFSHAVQQNRGSQRQTGHYAWLMRGGNPHFTSWFTRLLFSGLDGAYALQHDLYRYAASIGIESVADEAAGRMGGAQAAASALLKLSYANFYDWELGTEDETCFFEPEELNKRFLYDRIERFEQAVARRQKIWNGLVAKEILSRSASHPTVRMRLESLGVTDYQTLEKDHSPDYAAEVEKGLCLVETVAYEQLKEQYKETREQAYLEPKVQVEAWEAEGCPLRPETYADINTALRSLGQHTRANALAQKAMETFRGDAASYAYFVCGCYLLNQYDPKGLELVYRAIGENQNYIDEGLEIIGKYCCMVGNREELDIYREKALELAQKQMDLYSKVYELQKGDDLRTENLPEELLRGILAHIAKVDNGTLDKVYLVRKTITEDFFTSAFVLKFKDPGDPECDKVYHKIFRYLDALDWQFSLFYYDSVKKAGAENVSESCVYSGKEE